MAGTQKRKLVALDPETRSTQAHEFEAGLAARIVGQDPAVGAVASLYQVFQAGMNSSNRPIGTMLFLGPTGAGKTRVVEATAETLFGDPNAVMRKTTTTSRREQSRSREPRRGSDSELPQAQNRKEHR